jgi:branched-chain amino acid transport system substrate-binding protein
MIWRRRDILKAGALGATALSLGIARPARAAEPFRIGALNPVTGAGSPYGSGMQRAILLAAEEVNAAGGAGGRKLEVFPEDSQTSPDAGVLAAKKLIEVNKVEAILGTWSSGVTLAVGPIIEAAGLIHMTNAGAGPVTEMTKRGLIFRFSAISEHIGEVHAQLAAKEGFTRVATMAFNNASGRGVTGGAKSAWEKMGRKLVAEVVYEPNRPSYRSEIQRVLAADPEAIIMGAFLPDMTVIVREVRQAGSDVKFIAPAFAATQKLIDDLGPEMTNGILTTDYVAALQSPAYERFAQRFKEATGSAVGENYYASCAYDMVIVTALALEAAGPGASRDKVVASIRQVANPPGKPVAGFTEGRDLLRAGEKINYEGASGPLDFDEKGDVKALFKLSVMKSGKIEFIRMLDL